jgi:hypothetical protein
MPPGDESQFACMFRVPPEEAKRKLKSLQSIAKKGPALRDKKLANFGAGKLRRLEPEQPPEKVGLFMAQAEDESRTS